jgi:predicted aspartyl protease
MLHKLFVLVFIAFPFFAFSEVPLRFPFEIVNGAPVIKATIDGQEATLLLDLGGAGELSLKQSFVARASLKKMESEETSINASGERGQSDNYRVASLASGEMHEENLIASVWNSGSGADGYLGIGYMGKFRIVFDYPSRELRLYRRSMNDPSSTQCDGKPIPIKAYGTLIYTEAKTDFGTRLFALDTGANANVLATTQKPEGEIDSEALNRLHYYKEFSLNGQDMKPGRFAMVDIRIPLVSGVLGMDFFETRVVCLDLANRVMTIR